MAFTGNYLTTSFKQQILEGVHDLRAAGDTIKLALYTDSAAFDASTTAYTATNEISPTGSYPAGGVTLTSQNPTTSGTTAFVDFVDLAVTSATFTARGALIYNSTPTHTYTAPVIAVLDFGADKVVSAGALTIEFPTASASTAIIRVA